MPSEQRTTQTTNQSSQTSPWAPAQSSLMQMISRFSELGRDPSYMDAMTGPLSALTSAAGGLPNLGPEALGAIQNLYNSSTSGAQNMLNSGFNALNSNIGATARGEELDPYATPGFSDALTRMTGDITDRVKSVYNASGRDPSGAGSFAGSLGRGLTEGIAPIIQSQFNTNNANRFGAANQLFNAAGSTAGALTQQAQVPLQNALQAIQASGQLPGLFMQPAGAQFDAAQKWFDVPWQQAQRWQQGLLPIAALGGQSQGTGTTEKVTPDNTFGNILGGITGGLGALKEMGGISGLASLFMLSDERVKENIDEIGATNDGQPIYSYNYIGDKVPRIGLMAQDVEKIRPDAVIEIGGVKAVDYGKATERSRKIGMMHRMLEAA